MRAWRRPPGYLAFVAVGLACVAGATITTAAATSEDPGSRLPLYVGVGSIAVFMVLLVAYQWVGTALAARPAARDAGPARAGDPPADLLGALVVDASAGPPPAQVAGEMRRGAINYQALVSALALSCVLGGLLYAVAGVDAAWKPFGESGMGFPVAFAPAFAVLAWGILTHARRMRWALEVGDDFLAPLGLRIVAVPQLVVTPGLGDSTRLVGGSVMSGRRHGRRVEIVLGTGEHTVALEGPFPAFAVRAGRNGALATGGAAPEAVAARLAALTPGPRWRGLELHAGPEGLTARRDGGGSEGREHWLDDLWLAEELAAASA